MHQSEVDFVRNWRIISSNWAFYAYTTAYLKPRSGGVFSCLLPGLHFICTTPVYFDFISEGLSYG